MNTRIQKSTGYEDRIKNIRKEGKSFIPFLSEIESLSVFFIKKRKATFMDKLLSRKNILQDCTPDQCRLLIVYMKALTAECKRIKNIPSSESTYDDYVIIHEHFNYFYEKFIGMDAVFSITDEKVIDVFQDMSFYLDSIPFPANFPVSGD